jgi:hypothetical protein
VTPLERDLYKFGLKCVAALILFVLICHCVAHCETLPDSSFIKIEKELHFLKIKMDGLDSLDSLLSKWLKK